MIYEVFDRDKDMLCLSRIKVPPWCQTSDTMYHSVNVEQYWQICEHKRLCMCVNACIYVHIGTYVSICVEARGCSSGAICLLCLFV